MEYSMVRVTCKGVIHNFSCKNNDILNDYNEFKKFKFKEQTSA